MTAVIRQRHILPFHNDFDSKSSKPLTLDTGGLIHNAVIAAQERPAFSPTGTKHAAHENVARKVGKFLDTNKRLKALRGRLRKMRNRLEEALEDATSNRKRAERGLMQCRQA